jgi:Chaperone of endosialidase
MAVPYTFGNATTSIPLSNLDTNFATAITLGNTAVYLGNTTTSFGNVTLTNLTVSSVASAFPNSFLANSSVTINGSSVSLGGSVTITATSPGNLTIGTGLSGTSYNGSANVTIAIDSTVATLTGAQTLTNKTISGANNTLSNIGNGSLSNSNVTIGNTSVSLGGTATTLGNVTLTNVTISNVASTFPNSFLANSTSTLGNATITLGGTTTNVGNLTLANVTITSVGTTFPNNYLSNSAVTIGNTSVSLGSTVTSFGNVTLTNATISSVSTPLTVSQGGTGLVTITANGLMTGNGTGNVTIISAGTTGNVLTSNGTAWLSTAPTAQVYPGAGIANSTGTAWGTSYTTTGTGTVVALATSPTFVTPILGTPTSGTLTNTTGFPAANLAGTALPSAIVTSSLTSVGTIGTGVWNGTIITGTYGGTGVNNGSKTITLGGNLTTSGAFNTTFTTTATTAVTLPTSGTIMSSVTALSGAVTGTPSSTTYLRGDATWATVSGGGSGTVNSGTQYQLGYYATTGTAISGSSSIVTDANGNLGLGVTPSAWTVYKALQVNGAVFANSSASTAFIGSNWFYDGADKYIASNYATIYRQNAGSHSWLTAPSGTAGNAISFTQAMTLTSGGALGVGTTSPSGQFEVSSPTYTNATFSSSGAGYYGQFQCTSYTGGGGLVTVALISDGGSAFGRISTGSAHPLVFGTVATEAMRIDTSQNVYINTTSQYNASRFNILTTGGQNGIGLSTPSGANDAATFYTSTSTFAGRITPSGSSTSYQTSSDYRLKENIQPMTGALDKVKALKPITFDWIADKKASQGFIAHELQEIVPECVHGSKDEVDADGNPKYQGIDTSFLVATLTSAIQELSTLITAQQSTIQSLTERITALENK